MRTIRIGYGPRQPEHGRRPRVALAVSALALVGLFAGCTAGGGGSRAAGPPGSSRGPAVRAAAVDAPYRLTSFTSCTDLIRRLKAAAKNSVGPYGLPGGRGRVMYDAPAPAASSRAVDDSSAAAPPDHSGTNVQEVGVDEPDQVKTDGRRIVLLSGGMLRVVDAASRRVTGSLQLDAGYAGQLLLAGDRALVLSTATVASMPPVRVAGPVPFLPANTSISLVDLSQGSPRLLGRLVYDGVYVDARQVGGVARIVLTSRPTIQFPYGPPDQTDAARIARNRLLIERTGEDAWLPHYTVTVDGRTTEGRLPCDAVQTPQRFSGASLLSVLTVDLGRPLGSGDPVGLAADGDAVYATATGLYVAHDTRWERPGPVGPGSTELYQFDIGGSAAPVFVASGAVPGHLIGSYALSEYAGALRVATTLDSVPDHPTPSGVNPIQSTSGVSVLTRSGAALRVTGSVRGMGAGEQIYAVRFAGPVAYVVTFRQTDPLYVVDLRDAANPRVAGELKLPGYSSYLHPLDGGRVLGVGQLPDAPGTPGGLQVALFDVADPAHPVRTAAVTLPRRFALDGDLAHAFLYWPATRTAVIPYLSYGAADAAGFLVLGVGARNLAQRATLSVGATEGASRRTLVIGNTLWTLSDLYLTARDLRTLAQQARLAVSP